MDEAQFVAHLVHHGGEQIGPVVGGAALGRRQGVRSGQRGELGVVGGRRIDVPPVTRRVACRYESSCPNVSPSNPPGRSAISNDTPANTVDT